MWSPVCDVFHEDEETDKVKETFFSGLDMCKQAYHILRNNEEFQDELKEVYGENCLEMIDKIFDPNRPRQ